MLFPLIYQVMSQVHYHLKWTQTASVTETPQMQLYRLAGMNPRIGDTISSIVGEKNVNSLGVNPADAVMLISLSKPNDNNKTDEKSR